MSKASRFWEETEALCSQLSTPRMTKLIQAASKTDACDRMKVWNNEAFKRAGIRYYANWVAIKDMCDYARKSVENAQSEVRVYIRENPNQQEARQLIKTIAPDIQACIAEDLKSLQLNDLPAIEDS